MSPSRDLKSFNTERLSLRPRDIGDLDANLAMDLEADVGRYLYPLGRPSEAQLREKLRHQLAGDWPDRGGVWSVEWRDRSKKMTRHLESFVHELSLGEDHPEFAGLPILAVDLGHDAAAKLLPHLFQVASAELCESQQQHEGRHTKPSESGARRRVHQDRRW